MSRMLLAACMALAPAAAWSADSVSFHHQDWELACDNTRACRAAGYNADESGNGMSVLLTRVAGPGTPVRVQVKFAEMSDAPWPETDVRLSIDGRDLGVIGRSTADDLSTAQRDALLGALRGTGTITFSDAQRQYWVLSGRGATAVMLKMDEFQGRLGTPGALVRRGKRDEASVPAAVPLPRVRLVAPIGNRAGDDAIGERPQLRTALQATVTDESCDDISIEDRQQPIQIRRLTATKLLASTRCWMGAYNEGTGYWVINAAPPYAPELVTTSAGYEDGGHITASQKGRGPGDCFWMAEWAWDGRRFVQTLEQTTGQCRGIELGGPWELPTVSATLVK